MACHDTLAAVDDHVIGRAFWARAGADNVMDMPIYGVRWYGLAYGVTHPRAHSSTTLRATSVIAFKTMTAKPCLPD